MTQHALSASPTRSDAFEIVPVVDGCSLLFVAEQSPIVPIYHRLSICRFLDMQVVSSA